MKKSTRIPQATDLLEAVAGFLEKELLPALEGSRQFNTRVSINALRIVQRELRADDGSLVADLKSLVDSGSDEPEALLAGLSESIRSGKLDESDSSLMAALRRYALARLAIDNPKYSSYLAAQGNK